MKRRKYYKASLINRDFFVIKGLRNFIENRLNDFIQKGAKVLDIGCGEQPMRNLIEKLGGNYVGVDIAQNTQNSVTIIGSLDSIPLPDNDCDVILCSEVIEHASDPQKAFSELTRVLKPDGKIILTTPFGYPLHEEPYDFARYSPYQIQNLANSNHLNITEISKVGNELEVIATTWDNMWFRANKSSNVFRYFCTLMRAPVNLITWLSSCFFSKYFPQKIYLNTTCVLTKN